VSEAPEEHVKVSGRPVGIGPMPDPLAALSRGRALGAAEDPTVAEMRKNRRINGHRTAASSSQVSFATGRPRDPMFYWKQNNLPYQTDDPEGFKKIREFCRILYQTHPVIASATDVFSKYPLTGMELVCKDKALTDFYTTLFFEQLDYEEYLQDVGREHWTVGEAWPFGSFNETLGVWESDELLNPDDIDVIRSPFLKEPRFQMKLPEPIRTIIEKREPRWEYEQLVRSYPELVNFVRQDAKMPVSNTLLKQIKFKGDTFNPRGIPILMRGFRAVAQEEMLNAAQDAIASRMYTPLILARLGASATDLGTSQPWIPTDDDLADFEDSLDAALAGDFRVLTHHFAVNMDSVFGRENMPNLNPDFDRITDRILQIYGLSRTMLTGAGRGETYAADAINRDLISQLLTSYQRKIKKFFRDRALVVAEAQEHYDYEVRGGKRYVIHEEVLEVDPETGDQRIIEQPKLLVPDLHIKAMTMQDEADQRQFFEALRASGVPISMKTRLVNVPIDLDEERDRTRQEAVDMAVEAQQTRKETYQRLRDEGLPIPDDLREDFEPKAHVEGQGNQPGQQQDQDPALPSLGTLPVNDAAIVPTVDEQQTEEEAQGAAPNSVITLPRNKFTDQRSRPIESDEQRATMPKPASLVRTDEDGKPYVEVFSSASEGAPGGWERVGLAEVDPSRISGSIMDGPRHIGMRRFVEIAKDQPLDEDDDSA